MPARTDSLRVAPPVTVSATFPAATSSATRMHGSSHSGGAATTIPSIHSERSRRSNGSATNGRSFRDANAFGRSSPRRSPLPAAARIAHTLMPPRLLSRMQRVAAYPETGPFDTGFLDVGAGNVVYWELCGNPGGKPAVVFHGGPGSGSGMFQRTFFDPNAYLAV